MSPTSSTTATFRIRAWLVGGGILLLFGGLGCRLYFLQVVEHQVLSAEVDRIHTSRVTLPALRGSIFDCNHHLLAQSEPVQTIIADPETLRQTAEKRRLKGKPSGWPDLMATLGGRLGIPEEELERKLNGTGHYVILKKKVLPESAQQLKDFLKEGGWSGITFGDDQKRSYPNGPLMSHVLGYMNSENVGMDGVEHLMDRELRGQDGWRKIVKDGRKREVVVFRSEDFAPRNGYNVVLTLDQTVQDIVEQEMDQAVQKYHPDSAVAMVMRPESGEILAMTSRPTFDPNSGDKPPESLKNRAIGDLMEPGSTFKVVTVAAALDHRLVSLDTPIFCENGKFFYGDRYLNDHEPFGTLNVAQVLVHSSNIGAAKIAINLGAERLHQAMLNFGFGEKALGGNPLEEWPGEIRGIVHPLKKWSGVSITRVAMGHEVGTTPLQMITAMCAVANGGNLMRPQIIRRIVDENGHVVREFFPQVRRRVVDPKAAHELTRALKQVISREGTAERAAVPGFEVAGKTGTAQKLVNGQYAHDQFVSSFIGYLPAEQPELCIYVMLNNPKGKDYAGGMVAAPVFREIAARSASYLNLKPSIQTPLSRDRSIFRAANYVPGP